MDSLTLFARGFLRSRIPLRRIFAWMLSILLLTGAASYSQGSRYALVEHGPALSPVKNQSGGFTRVPSAAAPPASNEALPVLAASRTATVVHEVLTLVESGSLERDCCGGQPAPRSKPVPVRTVAVDPPSMILRQPRDALSPVNAPPGPESVALTALDLSISRT